MIRQQRAAHKWVWTLFIFLLPTGILLGWLVVPSEKPVQFLQHKSIELMPEVLKSYQVPAFSVSIRTDSARDKFQLYWCNLKELNVPTAVIYVTSKDSFEITQSKYVGRIETRGSYLFPLDSTINFKNSRLILYDFIHEKIIEQINVKP